MQNQIDKIVLTHCKDRCVVHLTNGTTLHFNFYKMGMTYIEGLKWIEEEVLNVVNKWNPGYEHSEEKTAILRVA